MPEQQKPAEPPGAGRQDHRAMRAGAMWPIDGPASTDTLAAGGGLDLPGLARNRAAPSTAAVSVHDGETADTSGAAPEIIPGAFESNTAMHRQAGSMGGSFNGADIPATPPDAWLDDATKDEHRLEGGGRGGKTRP